MKKIYFLLLIILILSGCGQSKNIGVGYINTLQNAVERAEEVNDLQQQKVMNFNNQNYQGESCEIDSDCILPSNYAIQSNCLYQTYCDAGSCIIDCPLFANDKNEYDLKCSSDEECDCQNQRVIGSYIRCQCIADQCVAVVAE